MNYGLGSGLDLAGCVLNVSLAHDVVAIENGVCLPAAKFARGLLRNAAANCISCG